MDYKKLLEHSYEVMRGLDTCLPESRSAYLSCYVFDFTTYDGEIDELFGQKAVEVCAAINNATTFDYINDPENYRWFLLMCNMPFFADKLEWGTSIRGTWWMNSSDKRFAITTGGLWEGDEQINLECSPDQWREFTQALVSFASGK